MAGFMKAIETVNSAVRTLVAVALVAMLGVAGWFGYSTYNANDLAMREKDREIEERDQRITALEGDLDLAKKKAEKLEVAVRLLKVERRLAVIDVLDQSVGADGKTYTDVEFTEIDDLQQPISQPQRFRLIGKDMYVAGWVVKFEDRFIEANDPDRGMSLFAFKSIFGNEQKPIDGYPLDTPGERPSAFGTREPISDFEKQIWSDFWELAHDEGKKEALGARSLHGAAVFIENARKGWRYKISLRSTGDLDLKEQGESPRKPASPVH